MATRKRYTDGDREKVLATVRKRGINAAANKHGVPQSCVSRWAATRLPPYAMTPSASSASASFPSSNVRASGVRCQLTLAGSHLTPSAVSER